MRVTVNKKKVFALLDILLYRWTATPKQFPYDQRQAVVPQRLIPKELRQNKVALACFYFYACIYMRGGIESGQAFKALLNMWRAHPDFFNPMFARWLKPEKIQPYLRRFIGWDSEAASINWITNSHLLFDNWGNNPLNLLKGLGSYDEAVRRIRNKRTKKEQREAGDKGGGFRGFQYKMVSMLIYFYDWEGWLPKRFLYPAPADFHNFRLAIAHGGLIVHSDESLIRANETLSKPWRRVLMQYLRSRNADPVEVADAIWLFSLTLCGNSPLTQMRTPSINGSGMFAGADLPHNDETVSLTAGARPQLLRTCLVCPVRDTCELAIPAAPYYQRGKTTDGKSFGGKLLLRPRLKIENDLGTLPVAGTAPSPMMGPTEESDLQFALLD